MKTLAKSVLFTLFVTALTGCGHHEYRVDPRLEADVQKFRDMSKKYGNEKAVDNVTIDVVPHGTIQVDPQTKAEIGTSGVLGLCNWNNGILIDEQVFLMTPEQREIVVFHELGHCILGRPHKEEMLDTGMPASIMSINLTDNYQGFYSYPEVYYKELFQD